MARSGQVIHEFRSSLVHGDAVPRELPSLLDMTVSEASNGLQAGTFTSVDLVNAYLARIAEASSFRAVLQINDDALEAARELDEERQRTGARGPLHGLPILVKDNIVTKDRLEATAGSFALIGAKPARESSVIARLRHAGVVILGKSNLSEWANFRGLNIPGGWSPRGGQTLGAYFPNSKADGSSSGSAVAAALGLAIAALGTETMGSICDPAEINNVVGLKPTRGLIATDGTIPISRRQDVIGTLTRTVKDAAYMLNGIAGASDLDDRTSHIPFDPIPDFTSFCEATRLDGLTIGVPRNIFPSDAAAPVHDAFTGALRTLEGAGAKIVDGANFTAADDFQRLNQQIKGIVRSSEFKSDIAAYLGTLQKNPFQLHTAEDIIEFTKNEPREDYPAKDIGKFLWTQAEGIDVESDKYKRMVGQEAYFGGEGGILGAMEKYNLDVIATPSTLGLGNDLAAKMGFPVIAVPLGFWPEGTPIQSGTGGLITAAPGMPFCLTLISRAFWDGKLLQVAYAFEQLTRVRVSGPLPVFVPKTELKDVVDARVRAQM